MKRDLVDELYKTAYKRYREKYPNKDFASIPNFLDANSARTVRLF